jgi:hypothetical protein
LFPIRRSNLTPKVVDFSMYLAEALKILVAKQCFSGFIHFFDIQGMKVKPGQFIPKGTFSKNHPINIRTPKGIKSCIGICLDFSYGMDSDFFGKNGVDSFQKIFPKLPFLEVKVANLHVGMDSSVSSATAHHRKWLPEVGGKCTFQAFLNGKRIFLNLPSVEWSPLVAQFEKIPLALSHTAAKIQFPIKSTPAQSQSLVIRLEGFFFAQNLKKMIQRIQTIFMFLIAVAMGVTIGTELWTQSQTDAGQTWSLSAFALSSVDSSGEVIDSTSKWYLASLAALIGLLAIISIFQYKNRGKQMMINMVNSLLMVGLVALIFLTTNGLNTELGIEVAGSYQVGFWAVLVAMVLNMLANRFIRRDEALVRSVDRIR